MKGRQFKKISGDPVAAIQLRHFLSRHGRPGTEELSEAESEGGRSGWWEISAADGYKLHCDWVRGDNEDQLSFSEIAPR